MHSLFENQTVRDVKDFAERLRTRLQRKHGFNLGQGKTLHLLAEINGFDAWAALEKQLGRAASRNEFPIGKFHKDALEFLDGMNRDHDASLVSELPSYSERGLKIAYTPYGPVCESELKNLQEQFGGWGGTERMTTEILNCVRQVEENCESFRSSQISKDIILLADMLNTVLYYDSPRAATSKAGLTVVELARKARYKADELLETSEDFRRLLLDEPVESANASNLLEYLDFAVRLEP